jgi:hypothetical protein
VPDLAVTSISAPEPAAPGARVSVSWTVINDSADASGEGPWSESVYASTDDQLGGDILLATFSYDDTLAPGDTIVRTEQITVPRIVGPYRVVVCVDHGNAVAESDEFNNCAMAMSSSVILLPDLVVSSVAAPSAALADEVIEVSWVVTNEGTNTAFASWVDTVYLSKDGVNTVLGSQARLSSLPPTASYTVTLNVAVPGRIAGDYELFVVTDSLNAVLEDGDPSNNVAYAPQSISITQPPRPNLVVTDIVTPPGGLVGQTFDVTFTLSNIGEATARGPWADRVTAIPESGGAPILLGEFFYTGSLADGASRERTVGLRYPLVIGQYRIAVTTDRSDAVNEGLDGGEDDNTAVDTATFTVEGYVVSVAADLDSAPAGTPVTFFGQATRSSSGTPIADVSVAVELTVRGSVRKFSAVTDATGAYEIVFQPLSTEGGLYSLFAGPPGNVDPNPQDFFSLHALRT